MTTKEADLYQRAINQTYLPAITVKPFATKTVSIPATQWERVADRSEDRIEPILLAQELFIEMNGSKLSEDVFSLTSDKPFIQEFRLLYEAIFEADVDSDQYRKLKQLVELAQPRSPTARGAQRILKGLISVKESTKEIRDPAENKTMLDRFVFPPSFKQPYFKFLRMSSNESSNKLRELITLLDEAIQKNESNAPSPSLEPKKNKLEELPQPEMEFNPSGLSVKPTFREMIHLFQAKNTLKKQGIELGKTSPEKALQELRKARKLDQLAQDRHVAELSQRCEQLNAYLKDNPVKPLASVKVKGQENAGSPEKVIEYAHPIENFFDIKVTKRTTQEMQRQVNKVSGFLGDYASDESVDPNVQRLTRKYEQDTKDCIEGQKNEEIKFESNANLDELKETVKQELDSISKRKQKAEAQILDLLKPRQKATSVTQETLSQKLQTVPQRLIGLYIGGTATWKMSIP